MRDSVTETFAHGGGETAPLTMDNIWTSWELEPTVLLGLVLSAAVYLWAVARLRRRDVAWSPWRTLGWMTGLLLIGVATSSVMAVYDTTLFSAHSLQHMVLQMFAPVPLALAAPLTLALRALPTGGRRTLVRLLHSRYVKVVTHPLVAFALFVVSPFVLYYSPLYEYTLVNDWAHNLSHLHFVAVGMLLYVTLLGLDPIPNPLPYVFRFMLVIGVGVSHILLGIPIMMGTQLIAEDYYTELGRTWGPSLVADQQLGGALLWALGDVTVLAFILGIIVQWVRSDARAARRADRQLDRIHGDASTIRPWWEVDTAPRSETERARTDKRHHVADNH